MNTKRQKAFSIVNIIAGVIIFLASILLFAEPETFPAPLITLPLGLALWITGALTLSKLRRFRQTNEAMSKRLLVCNLVCFILSSLILLMSILLPVIAPMF